MYLDPGFGGMLVQIIVAIAAASGAILFSLRKKIRALFSKNKSNNSGNLSETSMSSADDDAIDTLSDDNQN